MSRRLTLIAPAAVVLLAGCGSASTSPQHAAKHAAKSPASLTRFLQVDAAHRAVELTLIAGDGAANNGFNFNGYGRGQMLVQVPRGWRVTVHCHNAGSGFNSCAVVSGPRPVKLAFAGASTPQPVSGLASGKTVSFTFTPNRTGTYRLASVVPGHEQARMYAVLDVTRAGRPAISAGS
jgi:hypothetical protein